MSSEFLEERRKCLEEEFFHEQSQRNLQELRVKLAQESSRDALREASGMTDDVVLDNLIELGITAETVMALSLVPLIQTAWADGKMQAEEREAILQGAAKKGIESGTNAFELLSDWLDRKPNDELFDAWSSYVRALRTELNDAQCERLRHEVMRFARFVAEAAGGFLGIGKVTSAEEQMLARIEAVFE